MTDLPAIQGAAAPPAREASAASAVPRSPEEPIPNRRRVERAIAAAYGQPVRCVLQDLAGRSLQEIRVELSRAVGDTVHDGSDATGRVEPGGRCFVDDGIDFAEQVRVQPGDCLVLNGDVVSRPVVSVSGNRLWLDHDYAVPPGLRRVGSGYRIVRPWQLSEWAVRCLCRRYGSRPLRADHRRARYRGRHQKVIERVFRLPFERFVENLLFAGEGVDYVTGRRREPVDVIGRVDSTVRSVYAHPRLRNERRHLRTSLLLALTERSEDLTLSFHLRADLPKPRTPIPD